MLIRNLSLKLGSFEFKLDELKWTLEEPTVITLYVLADLLVKIVGNLL